MVLEKGVMQAQVLQEVYLPYVYMNAIAKMISRPYRTGVSPPGTPSFERRICHN